MYNMTISFTNFKQHRLFILLILTMASFFSMPTLHAQIKASASETGKYKNVFKEAGYKQADIDAKVEKAYKDLFENPAGIYFEVGDSMAYVSDLKNHDARSEGLSYGMMVAVQ